MAPTLAKIGRPTAPPKNGRAELIELSNVLLRGLSIEEIARLLRRDHGDVQEKVVEIGRACREGSSVARVSEPKRLTAGM
jgi:hypothetical protein